MNTDKQYKLLKLYPSLPFNWEVGMILGQGDRGSRGSYSPCNGKYTDWYIQQDDVEKNPDYFTEVLPVSEPVKERIEIGSLNLHDNFLGNKVDTYWYQFCSNKVLDGTKFYEISNLLERYLNGEMNNPAPSALNDTVVEDKCLFDGERINKYLMDEFGQTGKTEPLRFQKRYSQKEVDTIRKEAFEAGRHRFQITSCGTLGAVEFRYPNYSDYLSSLNLNTNDISKDQNDKGNYTPPLSEIKEGKGWEVLTVKNKDTGVVDKINLLGTSDNYIRGISTCWDIESVKRLSDNVVFSVGNEVGYDDGNTRTKKCWKIDNFFIRESDNVMLARSYDNINVEVVDKWLFKNNPPSPTTPAKAIVEDKPVLFTTEDGVPRYKGDNCWAVQHPNFVSIRWVDICEEGMRDNLKYFFTKEATEKYILENKPCLSLNDLQNEWFTKDEQVQFGTWDGIPMYRRFKSIVKEKLK